MKVPMTDYDLNSAAGFYAIDLDVYVQTLEECTILQSFELGGGVSVHYGTRGASTVWLLDNPHGLYAVWVEDGSAVH